MAKSLDQFIKDTQGKSIGVPWNKALDGECVSLIQQYGVQCFGLPMRVRGHAKAYGNTLIKEGVAKAVKSPQRGDIQVYDGTYGHVSIYIDNKTIYDQNNRYGPQPARTAQLRPVLKNKPFQYIRMNKALIPDVKPPTPKKEYVVLDKAVDYWGIYKLGVPPYAKNKFDHLRPKKFGGLTYEVVGRQFTNTVTIVTRDYGKVNIWIGPKTAHKIVWK